MGGAIFFNSNDGTLTIDDSTLMGNTSQVLQAMGLPGIFMISKASPAVVNSRIE